MHSIHKNQNSEALGFMTIISFSSKFCVTADKIQTLSKIYSQWFQQLHPSSHDAVKTKKEIQGDIGKVQK